MGVIPRSLLMELDFGIERVPSSVMLTSIAYLALLQAKPQKLAPAVFADASARRIVNFSRSAYSKLKSAKFVIDSNGAKKTYLYSNGNLYGHQAGGSGAQRSCASFARRAFSAATWVSTT